MPSVVCGSIVASIRLLMAPLASAKNMVVLLGLFFKSRVLLRQRLKFSHFQKDLESNSNSCVFKSPLRRHCSFSILQDIECDI